MRDDPPTPYDEPDDLNALPALTEEGLVSLLLVYRESARSRWPYTATSPDVRRIEAEFARRELPLPESMPSRYAARPSQTDLGVVYSGGVDEDRPRPGATAASDAADREEQDMTDATQAADPVAEAKGAQDKANTDLKEAKAAQKTAKAALATAQKVDQSELKGDELKAAKKGVADAEKAVKDADQSVTSAQSALDAAKQGVKDARAAEKQRKAEERANRPKKAPLTLSQRRALLKLGESAQVPKTDFNALPYEHLVGVGLAQVKDVKVDGPPVKETTGEGDDKKTVEKPGPKVDAKQYSLTDTGKVRVGEINPKWRDWKPASTETPAESVAS